MIFLPGNEMRKPSIAIKISPFLKANLAAHQYLTTTLNCEWKYVQFISPHLLIYEKRALVEVARTN